MTVQSILQEYNSAWSNHVLLLELESRIFESLFQRWMLKSLKSPLSDFCIDAADVLDG